MHIVLVKVSQLCKGEKQTSWADEKREGTWVMKGKYPNPSRSAHHERKRHTAFLSEHEQLRQTPFAEQSAGFWNYPIFLVNHEEQAIEK